MTLERDQRTLGMGKEEERRGVLSTIGAIVWSIPAFATIYNTENVSVFRSRQPMYKE